MKTIVFAARKGGCSKTTLAAHLAVEAEKVGYGPVTLIDMDPQQSLTAWWNDRESSTPLLLDVPRDRLKKEIAKVGSAPGVIIIDTPPLDSSTISAVVEIADLVVIPVKPSPHDLRGVGVTVELVRRARKRFVFVVTQAVQRASLTQQAPLILSQSGPVATTIMYNRVDYAGAMTDGRSVQELDPAGKAADEIKNLWIYLNQQISIPVLGAA